MAARALQYHVESPPRALTSTPEHVLQDDIRMRRSPARHAEGALPLPCCSAGLTASPCHIALFTGVSARHSTAMNTRKTLCVLRFGSSSGTERAAPSASLAGFLRRRAFRECIRASLQACCARRDDLLLLHVIYLAAVFESQANHLVGTGETWPWGDVCIC